MSKTAVIIGAGHAGVQAAASLREYGWDGRVLLVNDEDRLPYERPPLSKTFDGENAIVNLRPQNFYDDKNIELVMGSAATALDAQAKTVTLADGQVLAYDICIAATGSSALMVPPFTESALPGIYALRNAPDEAALRQRVEDGSLKRLMIIGSGFIGLETAAALSSSLDHIRVVDMAPAAMTRTTHEGIAAHCVESARALGVKFSFQNKVEEMQAAGGGGLDISQTDGTREQVDAVLVSVGASPNDQLFVDAGLCQPRQLTADANSMVAPDLYAIGDMAMAPHPLFDDPAPVRLESVDYAVLQAKQAAAHICDKPSPRVMAPWFWSNQGMNRLQMVGIKPHAVRWVVRETSDGNGGLPIATALGIDAQGRLAVAQCLNNAKDFAASRKFWRHEIKVSDDELTDPGLALKEAF